MSGAIKQVGAWHNTGHLYTAAAAAVCQRVQMKDVRPIG